MIEEHVRRVLIYRLGSLGDMAIAVPALRLIARAFPNADRRMLTNLPVHAKAPAAAAVLNGSGLVNGYFSYPVGTRNLWQLGKLWAQLRLWRPEAVVYLAAARGVAVAERDVRFFRACGVTRVIGAPLREAMQGNFYGRDPGSAEAKACLFAGDLEPEAARLTRCVAELGDAKLEDLDSWALGLSEAERLRAAEAIGPEALRSAPLAVSVGTKVQAKDWGQHRWRQLLASVAPLADGRGLLLLGAPEEAEASEIAAEGWRQAGGGAVVNLCGKLSPRESAAALERACIFMGHDSGPMHLAASVGTPVIAVFAARNIPRQWFPFGAEHQVVYHRVECWGCGLETCVEQQKKCIESISVEEVLAAVQRALRAL
jgi:heptosyltransferase III